MTVSEIESLVSQGVDRAKAGEGAEVYTTILPIYDRGELPVNKHYAMGWIIYYAMHQAPEFSITERKRMLGKYLGLRVPRPHKLHSMILTEAIRLYKDAQDQIFVQSSKGVERNMPEGERHPLHFSILRFLPLWGIENLRPGDWRRKEHEGKRLNSTVEKLLTVCIDEYYNSGTLPAGDFMGFLEKAMILYQDSPALKAQRGLLYEMEGNIAKAEQLLREALLLSPGKFYLWSRLANLIDANADRRLKCSLYVKALHAPGQDQFKGRVRLGLAEVLAEGGAKAYALWELRQVEKLYEANKWHLPGLHGKVRGMIEPEVAPADPAGFYRKVLPLADEYLYDSLPYIEVEKTYHKDAGTAKDRYGRPAPEAWRVSDPSGGNYWLNPAHHNISDQLPVGSKLKVKIFSGKVVKVKL